MADVLIQAQNKSYVPRIIEYYERVVWNPKLGEDDRPLRVRFAFPEPSLASTSTSATTAMTETPSTTPSLHGRLGTSLLELSRGSRGGRGPGLVLVRGVLCSPQEFIEWVRWRSPFPRAVARLYWLGRERRVEKGGDESPCRDERDGIDGGGVTLGDGSDDSTLAGFSANTAAGLATKIAAVAEEDRAGETPAPAPSPSPLALLLKEKKVPVRVMALPRSLERLLIDRLCDDDDKDGAGWNLDPRAGERSWREGEGGGGGAGEGGGLFVVAAAMDGLDERGEREPKGQHDPPVPRPRYRAAIVRPEAVLSDTTEQRSRAARPSRAEWKLSEALAMSWGMLSATSRGDGSRGEGSRGDGRKEDEDGEAAATTELLFELLKTKKEAMATAASTTSASFSNLVAVDVGAAPGGWTRHVALSLRARCVVALDPSPNLDADVAALSNVRHVRMRSGDPGALEAVAAAVSECCVGWRDAERLSPPPPTTTTAKPPPLPLAHLLTCDANEPPVAASEAILPLLPLLRRGALVVLTLKLRFPGRDKGFATRAAMERLEPAGLELAGDPWCFANTMYERTLLLRKR